MATNVIALMLPIIAIVFGCGIAIIAIISEYLQKKKYYESLVKALETGKDPAKIKEMFGEPENVKRNEPTRYLSRGIIVIGTGAGVVLIGLITINTWIMAIGAFLGVIGIAHLIVHSLVNRNKTAE